MHSVALTLDLAGGDQVRADWVLLWQIGREVHLLPFKDFSKIIFSREAKLAQVPAFDEVDLAIARQLINLLWVPTLRNRDLIRVHELISSIVP